MLNKPGASAIITTAKPRALWIAKMFGDDDFFCFLLVVAFLKALVGKSRVYSLSLSSFPKEWPPAGLGNLLFVVQTTITTDPRQKHSGMTFAFVFCFLQSFLERSVLFSSCLRRHSRKLYLLYDKTTRKKPGEPYKTLSRRK